MPVITVILGSIREKRFGESVAKWIFEQAQQRKDVEWRFVDLRDFPMPFFDQATIPGWPGRAPYDHPVVKKWTAAIAASDGFIIVSPEYNYGPPGTLKNAIDWVYPEWNRKAVGFVSYGSTGGARCIQQLREISVELQLAPSRYSVYIPPAGMYAHLMGGDPAPAFKEAEQQVPRFLDDLTWWTTTLKAAREKPAG
jgi:NAD(P)H-dependent FMN reductase